MCIRDRSKQLAALEAAGYVVVSKERAGRRPRTWARITPEGRATLTGHLAALRAIAELTLDAPADET